MNDECTNAYVSWNVEPVYKTKVLESRIKAFLPGSVFQITRYDFLCARNIIPVFEPPRKIPKNFC